MKRRNKSFLPLTPSYGHYVYPYVLGGWGSSAKEFIRKIVREVTGEIRSTSFLIQHLALDVHRGNTAAAVLGTILETGPG